MFANAGIPVAGETGLFLAGSGSITADSFEERSITPAATNMQEGDILICAVTCEPVGGQKSVGSANDGDWTILYDAPYSSYLSYYVGIMEYSPSKNREINYNDWIDASAICMSFRNASSALPNRNAAAVLTGNPDPPSLSGITVGSIVMAIGCSDSYYVPTAPSGYSNLVYGRINGDANANTTMAAIKVATSTTEDPPAFGGSATERWVAFTLEIELAP